MGGWKWTDRGFQKGNSIVQLSTIEAIDTLGLSVAQDGTISGGTYALGTVDPSGLYIMIGTNMYQVQGAATAKCPKYKLSGSYSTTTFTNILWTGEAHSQITRL